jgi:hypothetical protein
LCVKLIVEGGIKKFEGKVRMNAAVRACIGYRWLRPFFFHTLATDFLRAGEGFEMSGDFSPVHYFLYCRSIELSLKAFLLAKKVSITRVKKWVGHDLERALKEAELQGLLNIVEIPWGYKEELKKANYYYKKKQGFEYADDFRVLMRFGSVVPSLKVLYEFDSMLVEKLSGVCNECVEILTKKFREELYIKDE